MGRLRTPVKGPKPDKPKRPKPEPTPSAQALYFRALDVVRAGTPIEINCLLRYMEKTGEICSEILSNADDSVFTESDWDDELTDSEFDYSDEDDFVTANAVDERQTVVSGDGNWEDDYSAFYPSRKFELRFYESHGIFSCSIKKDPRCGFLSNSPKAAEILDELALRYEFLLRIGEWLVANRKNFLQSGNLWDFVEQALYEAEKKKVSVLQKDFIAIAGLERVLDAQSDGTQRKSGSRRAYFSRFIKHVVLSFENGGRMPLSRLFSREARCAWVARAFRDKCRHAKLDMNKSMLSLKAAKVTKKNRSDRARKSLGNVGRDEAASLLCALACVSGAKAVEFFGEKIKETENDKH